MINYLAPAILGQNIQRILAKTCSVKQFKALIVFLSKKKIKGPSLDDYLYIVLVLGKDSTIFARILYLVKDQLVQEEDQPISFKFICALLK
jgi:hypothetical protein